MSDRRKRCRGALPQAIGRLLVGIGVLLLGFGGVASVYAQPSSIAALLQRMRDSEGTAYIRARAAALRRLEANPQALSEWRKNAGPASSWRLRLLADVVRWHRDAPQRARALRALRGLNPRVYLRRRRPEPQVGREIRERFADAAPLLAEVYLKTRDRYPFAPPQHYPETLAAERLKELRSLEKKRLAEGLLVGIAASKHPASTPLLREILRSRERPAERRALAAVLLGRRDHTASGAARTASMLARLARQPGVPDTVRMAAVRSLGMLQRPEALDVLLALLQDPGADALQRHIVGALGLLGSTSYQATSAPAQEAMRARIAKVLHSYLRRPLPPRLARATLQAIVQLGHATSISVLQDLEHAWKQRPAAQQRHLHQARSQLRLHLQRKLQRQ